MNRFNKWLKVNGQGIGFLFGSNIFEHLWVCFLGRMRVYKILSQLVKKVCNTILWILQY